VDSDEHQRASDIVFINFSHFQKPQIPVIPILHTGGVASSILAAPTISARRYRIDPRRKSGSAVLAQRFA